MQNKEADSKLEDVNLFAHIVNFFFLPQMCWFTGNFPLCFHNIKTALHMFFPHTGSFHVVLSLLDKVEYSHDKWHFYLLGDFDPSKM